MQSTTPQHLGRRIGVLALTLLAAAMTMIATGGAASAAEPGSVYEIRFVSGIGDCLTEFLEHDQSAPIPGFSPAPSAGARACEEPGRTGPEARWELVPHGGSFVQIVNRRSGRCLDWRFDVSRTKTLVQTQPCDANRAEQSWTFDRIRAENGEQVPIRNGRGALLLKHDGGGTRVDGGQAIDGWKLRRVE
jgi:hypothetical protein